MEIVTPGTEYDQAFQSASRLVGQSRAHIDKVDAALDAALASPVPGTPLFADQNAASGNPARAIMARRTLDHVRALIYATASSVRSLEGHYGAEVFYAVPALVVCRSMLEYGATAVWLIDSGKPGPDLRQARAGAAMFHAIHQSIADLERGGDMAAEAARTRAQHAELVAIFTNGGARVEWRADDDGNPTDEVSSVRIGNAAARTRYQFTQRIEATIGPHLPYGLLSSTVHGNPYMLASVGTRPVSYVVAVAYVAFSTVGALSKAVEAYTGTEFAPFINEGDLRRLRAAVGADDDVEV